MESAFSAAYLVIICALGVYILRKQRNSREYRLFGIMTLVLGFGDAFHLVPRIMDAFMDGDFTEPLGFGKLVTSVTMTAFYVMLYHFWAMRYKQKNGALTVAVYVLAMARWALCAMPQNAWLSADQPLSWGIYRNIPFTILGGIVAFLFFNTAKKENDAPFRFMWLAVVLSFAFYLPVVLFADAVPLVGMFMIPKTCMYVWAVWMGFGEVRRGFD